MGTLSKIIIYWSLPPFLPPPLKLCARSAAALFFKSPYCICPVSFLYTATVTPLRGRSSSGCAARRMHGQLRSGGMQAVQSFTFTRSPSPRSAAIHQIKPGLTGSRNCANHTTMQQKRGKKAVVEAKRLVERTAFQLFLWCYYLHSLKTRKIALPCDRGWLVVSSLINYVREVNGLETN